MEEGSAQAHGAGTSPCLVVVQKRLRAAKKKLSRITELEALQAAGKELTPEQLPIIKTKGVALAVIEELQKVEDGLKDAIKEEQTAAFTRGLIQGQADADAAFQAQMQAELAEMDSKLQLQKDELKHAHDDDLARFTSDHEEQREKALQEQRHQLKAAAETEKQAAVQSAVSAAIADLLKQEMNSEHPLKDLITEPIRKLMSLFYYAHLFDLNRNYWTATTESFVFQQYEAQATYPEGQAGLTSRDLFDLSYFAFSLIDRMNKRVSHQQALQASIDMARAWILEPAATAIPAPPAPAAITVRSLQERLAQIVASPFNQAVPAPEDPTLPQPPPAVVPPPPLPVPVPGFGATLLPPARQTVAPSAPPLPAVPAASGSLAPVSADGYTPAPAPVPTTTINVGDGSAPVNLTSGAVPSAQALPPGFLENHTDNDATTIVTAQALVPPTTTVAPLQPVNKTPGMGAGGDMAAGNTTHTDGGAHATVQRHAGVYVLSETGIPELRPAAGSPVLPLQTAPANSTTVAAPPPAPSKQAGTGVLSDILRNKAGSGTTRKIAVVPQQHASGAPPPVVGHMADPAAPMATMSHNYPNGGSRAPPPGVSARTGGPTRAWQPRHHGGRGRGQAE